MKASPKAVQPSFWTDEEITGKPPAAESHLGIKGRRLSNGGGVKKPAKFRANIYDSEGRKIWFGDIDIEEAGEALLSLSEKLGPLYLLHGTEARFLSRRPSPRFIRHIATVVIEGGNILYSRDLAERLEIIEKEAKTRVEGKWG